MAEQEQEPKQEQEKPKPQTSSASYKNTQRGKFVCNAAGVVIGAGESVKLSKAQTDNKRIKHAIDTGVLVKA